MSLIILLSVLMALSFLHSCAESAVVTSTSCDLDEEDRFYFNIFRFPGQSNNAEVYLRAKVIVCLSTHRLSVCRNQCRACPAKRKRRDIEQVQQTEFYVTAGPFQIREPDQGLYLKNSSVQPSKGCQVDKMILAELRRPEGLPSGFPYPYQENKETQELIFSCYRGQRYFSWACTHDGGVAQHGGRHGGHNPNNSSTETCSLVYFSDIGHPWYDQLTHVKTKYTLTRITRPYRGLKFISHQSHVFLN